MRRTSGGFLRQSLEGTEATIDLLFLSCTLPLSESYDGIEFTPECVQEPELEYEVS